jgi:catechol 2,3-dioxygenase-like lactoylglutathione lyase family enzyme
MPIVALDHIVLNVADVERSLRFYQEALGLGAERVDGWRRGELPFPSVRISASTIIDLVASPSSDGRTRTNLAHFCLVTDDAEFDSLRSALGAAGVRIDEGPVMRSGARGDALSIYLRDPDDNLIEVRTYARRAATCASVQAAHARLGAALEALGDPTAPVAGYADWTKKDLIAHLTSIEPRIRAQINAVVQGTPWPAEDIDTFNAREVASRRDWTLDDLRREFEAESAASQALVETLSEADLAREVDHPRRGRITLFEVVQIIPRHVRTHLADLDAAARGG